MAGPIRARRWSAAPCAREAFRYMRLSVVNSRLRSPASPPTPSEPRWGGLRRWSSRGHRQNIASRLNSASASLFNTIDICTAVTGRFRCRPQLLEHRTEACPRCPFLMSFDMAARAGSQACC